MKQNRWPILLGILLVLLVCCCVTVIGVAGYLWRSLEAVQNNYYLPSATLEPTPAVNLVLHPPSITAYETDQIVRHSTLPSRDLLDLARRLQHLPEMLPGGIQAAPTAYELGDTEVFWLHNIRANTFFTSTAVLTLETEHAYWWVEEGYRLSDKDLGRSARQFEYKTYPTNHQYFGSEWNPGVDGDPHVYIFLGHVPGVAGYFSGPDEYPAQIRPHSNGHEMFYINLDNAMPGSDYFDGILAHEFQHMIHWAVDRNEATWVNEGLSELAAQVNGYDVGGTDLSFSAAPDTQLTTWSELDDSGPHYGASYLLLAYFLDRYGEQALRQLVAEQNNGTRGFDAVLSAVDPAQPSFEDLFADWVIANYLDDPDLEDGRFGYADLRIEPPTHANHHATYPVQEQATVHQYATDYIMLQGTGDLTIEFTGSQVVPLVGNSTYSGDYQWWSNRGDEGDATLTRAFDLSGLQEATLQAWMWYDLELDYDYAYVEISVDGGQKWDILANEHTTIANPNGNSYGPAFTGPSGGDGPQWVQQTFDLTPYAGQPVLIRFEVITDEALNYPGLCLDDISIPELGYLDNVEEGDGGWLATGWLRVSDQVPQDYLVQLITIGRETRVERMALNTDMQGRLTLGGLGQEVDRAVLAVSAFAPSTTEWTAYSYSITQD